MPFERQPRFPRAQAGFTLIEVLAVVLIVGILATILVVSLGGATDAARTSMTETRLGMYEAAIDQFENEYGYYPASTFTQDQGVPNDGTNSGVEALVVALWSDGWEAGGGIDADELQNVDGDQAPRSLSDLGRKLLELVDDWDNPVAYIHRSEYGKKTGGSYLTFDPETGVEILSEPTALRNETTGRFYRATKYQLISSGSDGIFGTDDDITTFANP